ncbi:MAG: tetratricopeptide repeat protein [Burkholderiaceae bacterium]|nr:tetratricopeptide repeat protein [Burkholderiaceae bacterium]
MDLVTPLPVSLTLSELVSRADPLAQQGRAEEAIALYQQWLACSKDPLRFVALFNLGVLLGAAGRSEAAQAAYRQALDIHPHLHQARLNLGHQLEVHGTVEEALAEWHKVLDSFAPPAPSDKVLLLHALNNIARVLEGARRFDEAEAMMLRSLQVDPDQSAVLHHYVHLRQKQCEWPVYRTMGEITVNKQLMATSALAMLAAHDDPAWQLLAAREFVHEKIQAPAPRKPMQPRLPGQRIKIGYLSGDLCMHAVGLLTVELFELHDRERFEVYGFCWSRDDGSPLRARIVRALDHHVRIAGLDDAAAAALIEAQGIDILVDLQGLTSGARPNILAYRPAPLQISYLGLPGTSGMPSIDYIVADAYVYPPELEPYMTEKPLRLPRCYQVSDRQRAVGPSLCRRDCGLPEHQFVFAAFNNNYKFTPELFAAWMRVLSAVPDSVLWMLSDNPWAEKNLKREAQLHGVQPERLIFSGRALPTEYMARLQLPDLFLDTFPYNAGTTANDILWMGSPILTLSGRSYISRMCGSLLSAVGLPDLITTDLAEYERKAVQLGRNPRMVQTYKRYLAEHRHQTDLFNVPQLVRDLEAGFMALLP